MFKKMAAFNSDGTNENEQLSSGNTDDSLVQMYKLKASSTEKGTREKKANSQSSLIEGESSFGVVSSTSGLYAAETRSRSLLFAKKP